MGSSRNFVFKVASTPQELEQIRSLSYETFVEEIPQHPTQDNRLHTDKFEDENTYYVGLDKGRLIAMMALRAQRPFSLDQKLANLDGFLPPHRFPCELRLLSVRPEFRKSRVTVRLLALAWKNCMERGFDLALISGTTRQIRLYEHMGFEPFGPLVGTPGAYYQPMYLTLSRFEKRLRPFLENIAPEPYEGT